jgi:hypothetical protein
VGRHRLGDGVGALGGQVDRIGVPGLWLEPAQLLVKVEQGGAVLLRQLPQDVVRCDRGAQGHGVEVGGSREGRARFVAAPRGQEDLGLDPGGDRALAAGGARLVQLLAAVAAEGPQVRGVLLAVGVSGRVDADGRVVRIA